MRILVTGSSGYVASKLIPNLLASGYEVTTLDVKETIYNTKHIQGNILNDNTVNKATKDKDVVIHLAASFTNDNKQSYEVNYKATVNVADACYGNDVKRLIFASTCGVLNLADGTPYTRWKRLAEVYINRAESIILRLALVHGLAPVMNYEPLVNRLVLNAVKTGKLEIRGLNEYRPFVHIDDVSKAITFAVEHDVTNRILNVVAENKTKGEIAQIINKLLPNIIVEGQESQSDGYQVEVGLKTNKRLEESIKEMIDGLKVL